MIISKLKLANVKGLQREIELDPVNLVQGNNATGKTAIASALRIGLLGYDPKLGKKASATFAMSSSTAMGIVLEFSSGLKIARGWTQDKKGKITASSEAPPVTDAMLLDIDEYFRMTAKERNAYVASLAAEGALGEQHVESIVDRIMSKFDENELAKDATRHVDNVLTEFLQEREVENATTLDVVNRAVTDFELKLKQDKAVALQMKGSLSAAEQLQQAAAGRDRTGDIERLRKQLANLESDYDGATNKLKEFERLENNLKEAEAAASDMLDDKAREELEAELVKATEAFPMEERAEELQAAMMSASTKETELIREKDRLTDRIIQARSTIEICEKTIGECKERLERAKIEFAKGICTHCGALRAHWKDKEAGKDGISELEKSIKNSEELRRKEQKSLDEGEKRMPKLREEWTSAADTTESARLAVTNSQEVYKTANRIREQLAADDRKSTTVNKFREQLKTLGTAGAWTERKTSTGTQMKAVGAELEKADAEQTQYVMAKQRELSQKQAQEALEKLTIGNEVIGMAIDELKELREKAAGKQMKGFLGIINQFTEGILRQPVEFVEGEIGYTQKGRWIGHETMSGMERSLVYIGLGVALAAKSQYKGVIMDEMGILDPSNCTRVLDRMDALVDKGIVHQFIGFTSRPDFSNTVNIVQLV